MGFDLVENDDFVVGELDWFEERAKSKSPDDECNLAFFYEQMYKRSRAFHYFRKAANRGYPLAELHVGLCYESTKKKRKKKKLILEKVDAVSSLISNWRTVIFKER